MLSTSEAAVAADAIPQESTAANFFFSGHSSVSSLVPTPSARPSSQSARPSTSTSTHQICLPGPTPGFVLCVCCRLDPTPRQNDACCLRRIVVRVVGRRLSIVDLEFSVLSLDFREPRAPRDQTEPRVVFGTHSALPASLSPAGLFLLGAHHISRLNLFRSPLRRPGHHAFRDNLPTREVQQNTRPPPRSLPSRFRGQGYILSFFLPSAYPSRAVFLA